MITITHKISAGGSETTTAKMFLLPAALFHALFESMKTPKILAEICGDKTFIITLELGKETHTHTFDGPTDEVKLVFAAITPFLTQEEFCMDDVYPTIMKLLGISGNVCHREFPPVEFLKFCNIALDTRARQATAA